MAKEKRKLSNLIGKQASRPGLRELHLRAPSARFTSKSRDVKKNYENEAEFPDDLCSRVAPDGRLADVRKTTKLGCFVAQPRTDKERASVAQKCAQALRPSMPLVVDGVDDTVGNAYSGDAGKALRARPPGARSPFKKRPRTVLASIRKSWKRAPGHGSPGSEGSPYQKSVGDPHSKLNHCSTCPRQEYRGAIPDATTGTVGSSLVSRKPVRVWGPWGVPLGQARFSSGCFDSIVRTISPELAAELMGLKCVSRCLFHVWRDRGRGWPSLACEVGTGMSAR